jgi:hypothetical protein
MAIDTINVFGSYGIGGNVIRTVDISTGQDIKIPGPTDKPEEKTKLTPEELARQRARKQKKVIRTIEG